MVENTVVTKSERSIEDIILLYDDGSVKRLEKGMVVYFGDKAPQEDQKDVLNTSFDLLEMNSRDVALVVSVVVQFGMEMGLFDDPIFNGEEDTDDE